MNTNQPITMTDIISVANHAAVQSDRWLFLVALIVLGVFGLLVLRHFINQNERLINEHARSRDTYQQTLKEVVETQGKLTVDVAVVLTKNGEIIKNCGEIMEGCATEMRLCRDQNERHRA